MASECGSSNGGGGGQVGKQRSVNSDKVMRLNVGGVYYTTQKSTLARYHGSVLWRIATGNQPCLKDDRGNYVIDRDGQVFRHVLNFLRSSKLLLPQGFRELNLLKEEASYYGLDPLVQEIDSLFARFRRKKRAGNGGNNAGRGFGRRYSNSVGEGLDRIHEDDLDDDLDFIEDSWLT